MGAKLAPSSRNGGRQKRHALNSDINVTPMVDVMLVLLIIFMVASPMMVTGVNVDLPETSANPVPNQEEPLSVSVKSDGSIYLQTTQIRLVELPAKLQAIIGEKPDTRILIRGDKNIDYGTVMNVVAAINSAGFTKVALITDGTGGPRK